jgi:hypothetical protein
MGDRECGADGGRDEADRARGEISQRRSIRSVRTPPATTKTTVGAQQSALIQPSTAGLRVS